MAELASEENEDRIIEVLRKAPARGYTIQEISYHTGMCRATIVKSLVGLEAKQLIDAEKVGQSKLIKLSEAELHD